MGKRRIETKWGATVKRIVQTLTRVGAVTLAGLVVVGCGAIRPEHCPYANWEATGELHASKGFQSRLPGLYDTCMAVGVLPDGDAYVAGYQRGLLGFCTIENGWTWGAHRAVNPGTCPPGMAAGFDRAFTTRNRLEQMGLKEASMEARRDDIEELIIVGNVNDEQLLQELRDLRGDLDDLDAKQYRTRNGFAQWLRQMGLEAPFDLYNY